LERVITLYRGDDGSRKAKVIIERKPLMSVVVHKTEAFIVDVECRLEAKRWIHTYAIP
jgi:hypothetical protein